MALIAMWSWIFGCRNIESGWNIKVGIDWFCECHWEIGLFCLLIGLGEQHYYSIDSAFGPNGSSPYWERDQMKNNMCELRRITLIRVPYWYDDCEWVSSDWQVIVLNENDYCVCVSDWEGEGVIWIVVRLEYCLDHYCNGLGGTVARTVYQRHCIKHDLMCFQWVQRVPFLVKCQRQQWIEGTLLRMYANVTVNVNLNLCCHAIAQPLGRANGATCHFVFESMQRMKKPSNVDISWMCCNELLSWTIVSYCHIVSVWLECNNAINYFCICCRGFFSLPFCFSLSDRILISRNRNVNH